MPSQRRPPRTEKIDIRSDLAGAHSQMVDAVGILTLNIQKRLTDMPPPRAQNAAFNAPPRSLDLPEYLARTSAAAMRDVGRVATWFVIHADAAEKLHASAPPPIAFSRRMQAASDAMDDQMQEAARQATEPEPDRPDFVAFERAVLNRLAEAGLQSELDKIAGEEGGVVGGDADRDNDENIAAGETESAPGSEPESALATKADTAHPP